MGKQPGQNCQQWLLMCVIETAHVLLPNILTCVFQSKAGPEAKPPHQTKGVAKYWLVIVHLQYNREPIFSQSHRLSLWTSQRVQTALL